MAPYKKEIYTFIFGLLMLTTLTIPLVGTQNIDCNGKAFHCVNSTHFKICVDLGGGVSTTVDDFLIPCPRNTVCKYNNYFECEYQPTTTPSPTEQSDVSNAETSVTSTWENFDTLTLTSTSSDIELSRVISPTLTSEWKTQILNNETVNDLVDLSPINSANENNNTNSDISVSENYSSSQSTFFEAVTSVDGLSTTLQQVTLDNIVFNSNYSINENLSSTENILISDQILADSENGITTEIYNAGDIGNNTAIFNNISVQNKNLSEIYFNVSNPISDKSEHIATEFTTEAMKTIRLLVKISDQHNETNDNQDTLTTVTFGNELITKNVLTNLDITTLPYPIDRIGRIQDEHVFIQDNSTLDNITVQLNKDSINSVISTNNFLFKNISDSLSTTPINEFISTDNNKTIENKHDNITNNSNYENYSTTENIVPESINVNKGNILNHEGTEMLNISETEPFNTVTELSMTEPVVLLKNNTLNISNVYLHQRVNETKGDVTVSSNSETIQENDYFQTELPDEFKHSDKIGELSLNYENDTENSTKPIEKHIPLTTTESSQLYISKEPLIYTNKTFISHQTNVSKTADYILGRNYSEAPTLNIKTFNLNVPIVDTFDSTISYTDNVTLYVNPENNIKTTTTVDIKDTKKLSSSPVLESASPISTMSMTEAIILQDTSFDNTKEVTSSLTSLHNLNSGYSYSVTEIPPSDTTPHHGVTIQETLVDVTSYDAILNETKLLNTLRDDNKIVNTANNLYTNHKKYKNVLNVTEATIFATKSSYNSDINKEVRNVAPTILPHLQKFDTSTETSTTPNKFSTSSFVNFSAILNLHEMNYTYPNYQNEKIATDTHYNEGLDVTTETSTINFDYNIYDSIMATTSENEINDKYVGTNNLNLISNSEISTFYYKNSRLSTIMPDIENIKTPNEDKSYTHNVSSVIDIRFKNVSTNGTVTSKAFINENMLHKPQDLLVEENTYVPYFDSVANSSSNLSLYNSTVTPNTLLHKPTVNFLQTLNYENYLQDSKNNTTKFDADTITKPTLPLLSQINSQNKLNQIKVNNSNNILNTMIHQTFITTPKSYTSLNQSEILTNNNPKVKETNSIDGNADSNLDLSQNAQRLSNETKLLLKANNISLHDPEISTLSNLSMNVKNLVASLNTRNNFTNSIFYSQDITTESSTLSVPTKIELKSSTVEIPSANDSVASLSRPITISSNLPSTSPTLMHLQESVTENKVILEASTLTKPPLSEVPSDDFSIQTNSTIINLNTKAETTSTNLSPELSVSVTTFKYEATILQNKIHPESNGIYKSMVDMNTKFSSTNTNQIDKTLINTEITKSKNPSLSKTLENNNTKAFTTSSVNTITSKSLNCTRNPKSVILPKTQFICPKRGKYSDENNCNKFYICIGKHDPIVGICPNNSVFSEIRKQCTKNLSHCIRNNQFRCLAAGRFIDVLTNKFYYICVKKNDGYVRFRLQCQKGYYLNSDNIKCTQDSEYSVEDSSKNTSEKSTSETKSDESTNRGKNKNFVCEDEGKFSHPEDSQKYYVCRKKSKSQYRRKIKKCNSDEVFDKDKRKCVDNDSSE